MSLKTAVTAMLGLEGDGTEPPIYPETNIPNDAYPTMYTDVGQAVDVIAQSNDERAERVARELSDKANDAKTTLQCVAPFVSSTDPATQVFAQIATEHALESIGFLSGGSAYSCESLPPSTFPTIVANIDKAFPQVV